ncbi:sigma 54-interacting transcriptional regulator, partial [Acidobacteriota bacterium]
SYEAASKQFETAAKAATDAGDCMKAGIALCNLANCMFFRGRLLEVDSIYKESLAHFCMAGAAEQAVRSLSELVYNHLERGDTEQAERCVARCKELNKGCESPRADADIHTIRGLIALEAGHGDKALKALESALSILREQGEPVREAECLLQIARVHLLRSFPENARKASEKAIETGRDQQNGYIEGMGRLCLGIALTALGEKGGAIQSFDKAIENLKEYRSTSALAEAHLRLAGVLLEKDVNFLRGRRMNRIEDALQEADRIITRRGSKGLRILLDELQGKLEACKTARSNIESTTLLEVTNLLVSSRSRNVVLAKALDLIIETMDMERAMIILWENEEEEPSIRMARDVDRQTISDAMAYSKTVLFDTVQKGKPLFSADATADQRFREARSVIDHHILSIICVPMCLRGKVTGSVYVDDRRLSRRLDDADVHFLTALSNILALALENAGLHESSGQEISHLRKEMQQAFRFEGIVGESDEMARIQDKIGILLDNDSTVLIYGESGTGKEVVARTIHYNSNRRDEPFVAVDCGTIPETLIESELFGHVKGAFTDARSSRPGLFQEADGGTVFLDEISNTSPAFQAKLLRVLQEGEIRPVGANAFRKVDVRVLVATNKDLQILVHEDSFRADLFYRLNVIRIDLPALRERMVDLPLLVDHFIKKFNSKWDKQVQGISRDALAVLQRFTWPGNVRELESVIASAIVTASGDAIQTRDLPQAILKPARGNGSSNSMENGMNADLQERSEQEQASTIYSLLVERKASFWDEVHQPFVNHEMTKNTVRHIIRLALKDARGIYLKAARGLGLVGDDECKRFMNFIYNNDCKVDPGPYKKKPSRRRPG